MKKWLAIITCLILVLGAVDPSAVVVKADDPVPDVTIGSVEDLLAFADASKSDTYAGQLIVLTEDLDMSSVENFQMIGVNTTTNRFSGTFDGQGHTIKNLTISGTGGYIGFFRDTQGATVKNLTFDNANVSTTLESTAGGTGRVGVLAGNSHTNGGTYENITIKNSTVESGATSTGGMIGSCFGGITVTNCSFEGTVKAVAAVGGLLGYAANGSQNTFTDCTVKATLTSTGSMSNANNIGAVGGLLGYQYGGSLTLTNCTTHGSAASATNGVGGMVGYFRGASASVLATITDCLCTMELSADGAPSRVGGMIGYVDTSSATLEWDTFTGSITKAGNMGGGMVAQHGSQGLIQITHCASVPTGFTTLGMSGKIMGQEGVASGSTVTDCYAAGEGASLGMAYVPSKTTVTEITDTSFSGKTIQIPNVNRLIAVAHLMNGSNFSGATIQLTADLDLNPGWTASADPTVPTLKWPIHTGLFAGTFDGNGKKLSGLYLSAAQFKSGMFRELTGTATVKDLVIANSFVTNASYRLGLIAGLTDGATITNVTAGGDNYVVGVGYAGGLVGYAQGATSISDCKVAVNVQGRYDGTNTAIDFGGMIATADGTTSVSNVDCTSSITFDENVNVGGGIIGGIRASSAANAENVAITISNSRFGGSIYTNNESVKSLGGAVGVFRYGASTLTVTDFLMDGTVAAETKGYCGGIVGNTFETGSNQVTMDRCLVTGKVYAAVGEIGAFLGRVNNEGSVYLTGTITNSYASLSVCEGHFNEGTKGLFGSSHTDIAFSEDWALTTAELTGISARSKAPGLFDATGDTKWTSVIDDTPLLAAFSDKPEVTAVAYSDISAYRGATFTAPAAPAGLDVVFAGWFSDEALTTPIEEDVTSGAAYAKFVDAKVLSIRYQFETASGSKLRIVTTVDSLDLDQVGFKVAYTNTSDNAVELDLHSTTVYEVLTGWKNGNDVNYTPGGLNDANERLFSKDSANFLCYKLSASAELVAKINASETGITATPYWVTLDGTTVSGTARSGLKFQ